MNVLEYSISPGSCCIGVITPDDKPDVHEHFVTISKGTVRFSFPASILKKR